MQTVRFTKDIPHEGLAEGDVLSVDEHSAAAYVERKDAELYDAAAEAAKAAEERAAAGDADAPQKESRYGGQPARTIDDITDPQAARNRRVMNFTTVAQADPGPAAATIAEAESADPAAVTDDVVPDADASTSASDPAPTDPTPTPDTTTSSFSGATGGRGRGSRQAAPGANPAGGDAGGGDGTA